MNATGYIIGVTGALFLMIVTTRALPFIFTKLLIESKTLKIIGNFLPAYIMLLLVIYEIGLKNFTYYPYNIPAIAGLAALIIIHILKRQTLFSILVGTLVYIFISYLM